MVIKPNNILVEVEDVLQTYKSREAGIKALSNYLHWFPVRSSPQLAGIVADLIGDGHLQDLPKGRLDYCSNSMLELERFNDEIFSLFGIRGKARMCTTNAYGTMNLSVNNKVLARAMKLIGVPCGAKVFAAFGIPAWIADDKENCARFMNRLFSCEGCVDVPSRCIEINMYKSQDIIKDGFAFFYQIKELLERHYGIVSTNPFLKGHFRPRKDGRVTRGVRLKIKRKDAVMRFQKYVGFDDVAKREKFLMMTNQYKETKEIV